MRPPRSDHEYTRHHHDVRAVDRVAGLHHAPTNLVAMNAGMVGNVGGSQAHLNMQPFLTLSFCIALQGIFPSPN